jgi:sigma-B regulation protein RsbU (phosphoserine phosphatase)
MSKLGGDYFDFTLTPENEILLLMGDVAGHGVQAALMMAMAKSVFMLEQTGPEAHVNIMKSLNQTFYRLRKSSIKTMMTGQVVLLSNQADSLITNAGHTTPIIINENSIETINLASYPFGFSQKRKFKFTPFRLKENDIMVLYTDGIIESLNSREEMLGNEGFADMLKAAYSKNLNEFHNNIFALYNDWATSQSDDLTFLLIKRKENA